MNKLIVKVVKEEHRVRLVEELSQNITEIVQDPFGNYAITTTLEVSNQITTYINGSRPGKTERCANL